MKSVRWIVSYILVACLGLWMAFFVSMRFMAPAYSQEAPSSGELPAEFLQETQSPPAGAPTPTEAAQAQPAPQPPGPPPATELPPADMPIGDGMTAPSSMPAISAGLDGYVYDPTGKRDPFKPFKNIVPQVTAGASGPKTLAPLQRWDLDRLQVVGILWEVNRPRAMVRDPEGAVYTVLKNSKIGRNEGVVSAIREGEIVVLETYYVDGATQKESRVMEFKK